MVISSGCVAPADKVPSVLLTDLIHWALAVSSHSIFSGPSLNKLNERDKSSIALPKSNVLIS